MKFFKSWKNEKSIIFTKNKTNLKLLPLLFGWLLKDLVGYFYDNTFKKKNKSFINYFNSFIIIIINNS